jgi:hypothetical protein
VAGEQDNEAQRLPVPEAEAETLLRRVDEVIDELDTVVTWRHSRHFTKLEQWIAPNRETWDQDFHYSQLDLQAAIDTLQWFKEDVAAVLDQIREHNAAIPVDLTPDLFPDLGIPGAELG